MTSLVLEAILTLAVRTWLVLVICDPLSLLFACLLLAERVSDILLCDDWDAQGYRLSWTTVVQRLSDPDGSSACYAMLRYRPCALR